MKHLGHIISNDLFEVNKNSFSIKLVNKVVQIRNSFSRKLVKKVVSNSLKTYLTIFHVIKCLKKFLVTVIYKKWTLKNWVIPFILILDKISENVSFIVLYIYIKTF